jgi:hypothetical protein
MKVFISYSKKNPTQVQTLQEDLQSMLGSMLPNELHQIWYDKSLLAGHEWWASICEQIRNCDLFIFALSADSLQSSACQEEWGYAAALHKRILPIWVAGETNPNDLAEPLRRIQYIDYRQRDIPSYQQLQGGLAHLPDAVPLPDPMPPEPPVPTSPMIEIAQQLQTKLSEGDQWVIYGKLKTHLTKPSDAEEARRLLMQLRSHDELIYSLGIEIDKSLTASGRIPIPQAPTSRPTDAPPKAQIPVASAPVSSDMPKPKYGCSIMTASIIIGIFLASAVSTCGTDFYGNEYCGGSFDASMFIGTLVVCIAVGYFADRWWKSTHQNVPKA